MEEFSFEALGTKWCITVDEEVLNPKSREALLDLVRIFEKRFSRFQEGSESTQFRDAAPDSYPVSPGLEKLLVRAKILSRLTGGQYNPAIGKLLEHAGYDQNYSLKEKEGNDSPTLATWDIENGVFSLSGAVVLDFGGIGKGLCIDEVAALLRHEGYQYFLVEAGGDMYGTTKKDGKPWKVALEWPGQPDKAFGLVEIHNSAVAVSDSYKRRWGTWHHVLDPKNQKPVVEILACAATAATAFDADSVTSGLFLASENQFSQIGEQFNAQFVVFEKKGILRVSSSWKGELY
jgi:FAD:protein FMN transferase